MLLPNFRLCSLAACAAISLAGFAAPVKAQAVISTASDTYPLKLMSFRDIPFRTVIRQQYDHSCGSAALATLLRYHYGRDVGEAKIFESMYLRGNQEQIQKVGFSLLDMKQYLDREGMPSDGFRMSLDQLADANTPAITVVTIGTYKHFVVVKGIEGNKVLIGDPALGLRTYTRPDFEKIWSGIVFMVRNGDDRRGAFNLAEEWRPWASPPLGQPLDSASLFGLTANAAPIYQVTQFTSSFQ